MLRRNAPVLAAEKRCERVKKFFLYSVLRRITFLRKRRLLLRLLSRAKSLFRMKKCEVDNVVI
jgi:hypothetical protein